MDHTQLESISSEECRKELRTMELETYGSVVSTLRAQGELNEKRKKVLEDLSAIMKISKDRHKAEIRRAVNDEKLGCIASRLGSGVDTKSNWAIEGRRIVPIMPRLVYPTPFAALATKILNQNLNICPAIQTPVTSTFSDIHNGASSRNIRDPDDDTNTLSPVIVPTSSVDFGHHSYNNFELDSSSYPHQENNSLSFGHKFAEMTAEPTVANKRVPAKSYNANPIKRPRSSSSQQTKDAPLSKLCAISPLNHRVRPIQKVVTNTPLMSYQLSLRGHVLNSIRPPIQQYQQQHFANPISAPKKIRVRVPLVRTAPTNMEPTIPHHFTQPTMTSIPPIVAYNNTHSRKQVVQTLPTTHQFQQQQQQRQQISSRISQENERYSRAVSPTRMSSKTVSLAPTGSKKKNVRAKSGPSDQGGLVVGNAYASSAQEAIDRATSHKLRDDCTYVLEFTTSDGVHQSISMENDFPATSLLSEQNRVPRTAAQLEGIGECVEHNTLTEILLNPPVGERTVDGALRNFESDNIHYRGYNCISVFSSTNWSAPGHNFVDQLEHHNGALDLRVPSKQTDTSSFFFSPDVRRDGQELEQFSSDIFTSSLIDVKTSSSFDNNEETADNALLVDFN